MKLKSPDVDVENTAMASAPAPPAYEEVLAEIASENNKDAIIQVEPTAPLALTEAIVITQQPIIHTSVNTTSVPIPIPVGSHEVSSNLSTEQFRTKVYFLGIS